MFFSQLSTCQDLKSLLTFKGTWTSGGSLGVHYIPSEQGSILLNFRKNAKKTYKVSVSKQITLSIVCSDIPTKQFEF